MNWRDGSEGVFHQNALDACVGFSNNKKVVPASKVDLACTHMQLHRYKHRHAHLQPFQDLGGNVSISEPQ